MIDLYTTIIQSNFYIIWNIIMWDVLLISFISSIIGSLLASKYKKCFVYEYNLDFFSGMFFLGLVSFAGNIGMNEIYIKCLLPTNIVYVLYALFALVFSAYIVDGKNGFFNVFFK